MPAQDGTLLTVNLARVMDNPSATYRGPRDVKPPKTGIDKRPADGPVRATRLGLIGDSILDTANHGGVNQALYAYAAEDADWWAAHLGADLTRELTPGSFGENLTTRGIDVTNAIIGELWRIGSAVLQVSVPRIPCSTFAGFWNVDKLVKRFTEAGRPGAYLRVLTEGEVTSGDPITVLDRPGHRLTLGETFRALTGDRSLATKLLTAPELPEDVHQLAHKWLAAV
jgi:MOSC domain-containing protein YiiM